MSKTVYGIGNDLNENLMLIYVILCYNFNSYFMKNM